MRVVAINGLRASTQVVTTYAPAQPFLPATPTDNECLIRIEDFDRVDYSAREATWPKNHRPDGIGHRTHSCIESSVLNNVPAPLTIVLRHRIRRRHRCPTTAKALRTRPSRQRSTRSHPENESQHGTRRLRLRRLRR